MERPVVTVDLRNHGDSPHSSLHTYEAMVGDMEQLYKEFEVETADVIGHSMGGKVAMHMALSRPGRINRLVVVDISPTSQNLVSSFKNYIEGMKEIESRGVKTSSEADSILKPYAPELPVRQFILTNLKEVPGSDVMKFRINLAALGESLTGEISGFPLAGVGLQYDGPALFIKGKRAKYITAETEPLIFDLFPNAKIVGFDTGHWVHSEKPEEFIQTEALQSSSSRYEAAAAAVADHHLTTDARHRDLLGDLTQEDNHGGEDGDGDELKDKDEAEFSIAKELLAREREYIRKNQEIESKAALSVKKAEQSVKESKVSLIRPISSLGRALENTSDGFGAKAAEDDNGPSAITPQSRHRSPSASKVASHAKVSTVKDSQGKFGEGFIGNQKNTRPTLKHQQKGSLGAYPGGKSVSASKSVKIDSPLDAKNFLPPGMTEEDIGLEAAYRLLKAKMAVMQEEMDKVVRNQSLKDNTVTVLEDKLKYFDDERTRISKNLQTLQGQIERSKKSNEELKKRNDSLESENLSLRKELDGLKKSQKDSESDGNTKEIRLNRALEEVEKYKQMMAKAAADSKDKMEAMKKTNEKLFNDYKKIQKQKSELLTIFKKQNQLIDVLKRQKLHLEAATLLGFSEEEFVRALNCRPGAGVDV
ncbi:hypothetical protein HDU76_003166 [Blyttiomyces sp. JEL0837]|nr:hypothetical protein HDU76_003166 [Blyttiomyces sp. JEL0837]